ncbi:Microcystin-dependent protein (MdpB) [uncultured Mediterranean phage uvMED]|nr:Microcystin-dependent protein (MdpB) [uncultured Mediterranean phage uvMED]
MTRARELADLINAVPASKLTGALPALDGSSLTGIEGTATGTILSWSTASIPSGFLECDGTAVSRSTYSALFAVVGTTYGTGDGSSTFNLPNLADNVPVGKSNNKSLASTGGANTVAASGSVSGSTANATLSTAQLASHSHGSGFFNPNNSSNAGMSNMGGGANAPAGNAINTSSTGSGSAHSHNMSANFSGSATSVVQPYLTVIYIIKT